jgi:hypothetical protein
MTPELLSILLVGLLFLLAGLGFIALTAYQAYRRGYNPIVWGIAGILALNPIFFLVVLAVAPHRSRMRLRDRFTSELDTKLTRRAPPAGAAGVTPVDPGAPTATAGRRPEPPNARPADLSVTRSIENRPSDPAP